MALTQAHLCLRLLQVQKWECENEQARKEGPRMRCVIHFHHGGWGQPGAEESLPIVHVHRTHMHMSDRERPLPQLSPICCNICQRKVKMSVNWGYFIHLAVSASHSLSSRSQLRLWGGAETVGGGRCLTSATKKVGNKKHSSAFPFSLCNPDFMKQRGVTCQSYGNPWHHTSK